MSEKRTLYVIEVILDRNKPYYVRVPRFTKARQPYTIFTEEMEKAFLFSTRKSAERLIRDRGKFITDFGPRVIPIETDRQIITPQEAERLYIIGGRI